MKSFMRSLLFGLLVLMIGLAGCSYVPFRVVLNKIYAAQIQPLLKLDLALIYFYTCSYIYAY